MLRFQQEAAMDILKKYFFRKKLSLRELNGGWFWRIFCDEIFDKNTKLTHCATTESPSNGATMTYSS